MSHDVNWDVDKYRDEHESEEQWELRKEFMERWKNEHPEERLVCLARVFTNIEFMGCRYPPEVMLEISRLSDEVAKDYRLGKKNKLQRTFVSASDAAEDRAKGVKRKGGIVNEGPSQKSMKINFVKPGDLDQDDSEVNSQNSTQNSTDPQQFNQNSLQNSHNTSQNSQDTDENSSNFKLNSNQPVEIIDSDGDDNVIEVKKEKPIDINYLDEFNKLPNLEMRFFNENMFQTIFGKLVILARPWMTKLVNIQASCMACGLTPTSAYENQCFKFSINNNLLAQATGSTKADARSVVETMAWNRIRNECITVVIKELFIAQGDARISSNDVSGAQNGGASLESGFGTPVESGVAAKMMKLMGWSGGGLGAEAQGISEPIKPHLQQIHRAGLGSSSMGSDLRNLRSSAMDLMRRYSAAETLDIDLVFAADFTKEERAELHQVAKRCRLMSRSYGKDNERFLVVKKKLDPFSLVCAVVRKGGDTPKYQVFIPKGLQNKTNNQEYSNRFRY